MNSVLQLRHGSCHYPVLTRRPARRGTLTVAQGSQQPGGSPSSTSSSKSADRPSATGPKPSITSPADTIVWGGRQPSARRAVIGSLTALGIALGGNLGGVTSWLFGLDGGQLAGQLHLDVLVPVRGFKRCVDAANGFAVVRAGAEFQYPAEWLADQTTYRRAVQRAEAARSLDPQPIRRRQREVAEPSVAFGPAASTGEENISVIVAPIYEGFNLRGLGTPDEAAQYFLDNIVAPAGSDKTAKLEQAQQRRDDNGTLYYQFEFTVSSSKFNRHNVAVLASHDNLLYTLNAQCPQAKWKEGGARLLQSAASFRLSTSQR